MISKRKSMTAEAAVYRYTLGSVAIDDQAVFLRRSPRRFFRSQVERWRQRGLLNRVRAGCAVLLAMVAPILTTWYFSLALVSNVWYSTGTLREFYWFSLGVFAVFVTWNCGFRSRRIPLARLQDGVSAAGERTIRLPVRSLGRWSTIVRLGAAPKLVFVRGEDRDQAVSTLERYGIDVRCA